MVNPVRKSPPRQTSPRRQPVQVAVRQGPPYHAKDFKVHYKLMGNDGQMWKIKMITKKDGTKYKRWVRI